MSIATEITRLQNIKTDIRSALVEQGIEDAGTHDMADFADDILAIEGGGGELHGAIVSVTTEEPTLAGTMAELYKVVDGVEELVDSKRFSELNDDGVASVGFVVQYAGTYIVRASDGTDSADSGTFDVSAEQIVNIEAIPIDISFFAWVSFADNSVSDAKIQAIIDAYYAGRITYDDIKTNTTGWTVGSVRKFDIDGTKYDFEIIGTEHDDLADGSGKALLTLQSANCLDTPRIMNSLDTNVGGWNSCAMRTWLNGDFYNSLPTTLKFKKVTKKTSAGNKSSSIVTADDFVSLLSEVEVYGKTTYSFAGEGTVYARYKGVVDASRSKKVGSDATSWWTRSPHSSNTDSFSRVGASGAVNSYAANSARGVAPVFYL